MTQDDVTTTVDVDGSEVGERVSTFLEDGGWRILADAVFRDFEIAAADREDLLQDALLSLIVHAATTRDAEGWFVIVLRNRCLRFLRREARKRNGETAEERSAASRKQQRSLSGEADLARLLGQLPARHRRLVEARFLEGRSFAELAGEFGNTAASLRTILYRILTRIRRKVRASTRQGND